MGRDREDDRRWERFLEPEGPPPPPDGSTGPGASARRGASGPGQPDADGGEAPLRWDLLEDDEEAPRRRGGRGRALLLAALVPWVIIAAILWRTNDDTTLGPHGEHVDHVAAEEHPSAADDSVSSEEDAWARGDDVGALEGDLDAIEDLLPEPDALRFGPRASAGAGEAAAVAHLVAREWLDDVGVPLGIDEIERSGTDVYVEHIVVESVDVPSPDAAVVTLVALLLEVSEGSYDSAEAVRVAVPLRLAREGARPAGTPWRLPAPDLRPLSLDERVVEDDPTLLAEAGAALQDAGYRDIDVTSVALSDSWPIAVSAKAIAPGQSGSTEHTVWLRQHLDGLVVAGWLPDVVTDDEGRPLDRRQAPSEPVQDEPGDPSPTPTQP